MFHETGRAACSSCSTTARRSSTRPRRTRPRPGPCSTTGWSCSRPRRARARTSAPSPTTWPGSRSRSRTATRTCAPRSPRLRRRRARSTAAHRARADAAGAAGQRGQRRPGGDLHLAGLEQLLVIFPHVISSGFTGTPGDGYGHVNLQLDQQVQPCTQGYLPHNQWRPPSDLSDGPIFPAQCTAGEPFVQRGTPYSPDGRYGTPGRGLPGRLRPHVRHHRRRDRRERQPGAPR